MEGIAKFTDNDVLDLDQFSDTEIENHIDQLDIRSARVKFDESIIHIGELSYFNTVQTLKPRNRNSAPGDFDLARIDSLRKWLIGATVSYKIGTHRGIYISSIFSSFRNFIHWSDTNGHADCLHNQESYLSVLLKYDAHIKQRITNHGFSKHSGAVVIGHCIQSGQWAFDLTQMFFKQHMTAIRRSKNPDSATEPPTTEEIKFSYGLNGHLFRGLTDFLLDGHAFPHQIRLPKEHIWILPTKSWCASNEVLEDSPVWGKSHIWNHRTGKMYSVDEIASFSSTQNNKTKSRSKERLAQEKKNLEIINTTLFCRERIILMQWAHDAYLVLFSAITGANEDSIRSFTWDDSIDVKSSIKKKRHKFRTIKYRAHGKEVEFELRANSISLFERFIELRKYILNGRQHPFLFLSQSVQNEIGKLRKNTIRIHSRRIQAQLYKEYPIISYKKWRANLGTVAFDESNIRAASAILQTSEKSIINSYSKGTIEKWEKDLHVYFNAFSETAKKHSKSKVENTAIGRCADAENPESLIQNAVFVPDCRSLEGCLHCSKFLIHCDEEDLRKILSMQYVIFQSMPAARTQEHFDIAFKATLDQIESIIKEISSIDEDKKNLIRRIQEDVFENENLTEYWQQKLELLIELDLIQ